MVTAYCTPPSTPRPRAYAVNNVNSVLNTPNKKDSVSKSRSMSNLACDQVGDSTKVANFATLECILLLS